MRPAILVLTENGSEFLRVGDETVSLIRTDRELDKEELERHQLDHFNDSAMQSRKDLAVEVVRPGDRPDFLVVRNGTHLGLDVTAFAFTERRQAANEFRKIKARLRAAYNRGRLRACEGITVELRFVSEENLPPQQLTDAAVNELVDAFERLAIDEVAWAHTQKNWVSGESASPYPLAQEGYALNGAIHWYVPGLCCVENNFTKACRFQLEHKYSKCVSKEEVKARLDALVEKHDHAGQGIDELLIVAGGPDRWGEGTVDEAVIADTFIKHWCGIIEPPKLLNRVVLYNWQARSLNVLYERATSTSAQRFRSIEVVAAAADRRGRSERWFGVGRVGVE